MDDTPSDPTAIQVDDFPDSISSGSTILLAGAVDPSTHALGLHGLCRYSQSDDTALVVTTTTSADRTVETYDAICDDDQPALELVDTTSEKQYLTAFYEGNRVVFVPAMADLERLVVALSDLTESHSRGETRHLVVRSITPLLEAASTDHVCTVLERITGLRTGDGFSLLGFDYTAHDRETLEAVGEHADHVLWVTRKGAHFGFELHDPHGPDARSRFGGDSGA